MTARRRHPLISGARVTALGTLGSRVLGMLRDIATAALLGLSSGGVMDAFVLAFRVPNLFRRLFGEGALAAAYLPVLTGELEKSPRAGWRLASVVATWLTLVLCVLVVVCELLLGAIWLAWGNSESVRMFTGLAAVLMPYLLFICLAAQASATLHALGRFAVAALVPVLLNICWLVAAVAIAPHFAPNQLAQAYVLSIAILLAGVLQFAVQVPLLRRLGFRFDYAWSASREAFWKITRSMLPMLLGLTITQINTLLDSLIAWGLASAPGGSATMNWAGRAVAYPMTHGAAAAIYFGERLYQFPLGILGLAVATAIFPLLSRHAVRGDRTALGADLTLGIRLVLALGIPASAGLMLLSDPLARLLFQHGQFTAEDATRTASMIACYGAGVWAYCALPVVVRGFYAMNDQTTPVKVGALMVGLNLTLNLVLVWPFAERGLATATALSSAVQVGVLLVLFSRGKGPIAWSQVGATTVRAALATLVMAGAGVVMLRCTPVVPGTLGQLLRVVCPLAVSLATYAVACRLLRADELKMLLSGREK